MEGKLTWRSYVWHYFSAVFCPWRPSEWRMGWRTQGGPVPRCWICSAAFGACQHTGGPIYSDPAESLYDGSSLIKDLDPRVEKV